MGSRPTTLQSDTVAAGDSSDAATTQASKPSQYSAANPESSKPAAPEEEPTAKTVLLLVSCFLAMFLVALDRTIISTV